MTWMCKKMSWKLKFGVHYHVVVLDLAREAVFLPGDQTPEGLLDFGIDSLHPGLPATFQHLMVQSQSIATVS